MRASSLIRNERLRLGLSQSTLASQAQVSLPALQQLEAGRSNPSLETLERLSQVLGLEVKIEPRACNWNRLVALGLPLTSKVNLTVQLTENNLIQELRIAIRHSMDERTQDAVRGLLLAIFEYYPSVFRRAFGKNAKAIELLQNPSGRVIKLKRLAASKVSKYL